MRTTISFLLIVLLVTPLMAATTGDPLDTNDRLTGTVEASCAKAYQYPYCDICWTQCYFAIIAESYFSGGDWGIW